MSARPRPVSSATSRSAPRGIALVGLEPTGHGLPDAREDPVGRAPDEQDLGLAPAAGHAEDPALDEVRPDGSSPALQAAARPARGAARGASGRGRRRTAATPRSAAARPAGAPAGTGPSRGRRSARAARSTRRWLWRDPAEQRLAVGIRLAGDARHDRRRVRRPAARRRRAPRRGQAGPRFAVWPMAWATFQSPSPPGARRRPPGAPRRSPRAPRPWPPAGARCRRAARPGAPPHLAPDPQELALVDAAPRSDDVGRAGFEGVDPAARSQPPRGTRPGSARKSRVIVTCSSSS